MSVNYSGEYFERPTGVLRRGKPGSDSSHEKIVHRRRPQTLKGMKEGLSIHSDYMMDTYCSHGYHHLLFTNDVSLVTCEKCLERAGIQRETVCPG